MAEFMVNRAVILTTPFLKYLGLYLDYMSYVNNIYEVGSTAREAAARVFFELFIATKVSLPLKGRRLIDSTIRYCLQWCLDNYTDKQE